MSVSRPPWGRPGGDPGELSFQIRLYHVLVLRGRGEGVYVSVYLDIHQEIELQVLVGEAP